MSRILIAEDEPRIAAFIEKGLRQNGFTTTVIEDGNKVVPAAKDGNFDLMILDLGLPGKDGWAILAELRRQGDQIPIIIVTARDISQRRWLDDVDAAANDYISKPFRFKDLLERIRIHLGHKES
ncbi:MAG: response regulator transcription factor [Leptolyngbyaceae cyanobacterium SL_5_9]|nr:response regulator transcription factor [Leptolyngbyaceae cyanobacterium SL_5_9]